MTTALTVPDLDLEKIELIKQTVARGVTDVEFELFIHACKRTGLDPLMKQIHAIKRWDSRLQREAMAIQTGIDGYRLIADRTGNYAPGPKPTFTYLDGKLDSATAYIKKRTEDGVWHLVEGEAFWEEYVQTTKQGEVTSMWKKGRMMLAKCAEALALRKAFPAELSGVYTHEEMMQADNVKPSRKPSDILAEHEAKLVPQLDNAGGQAAPPDGLLQTADTAEAPLSDPAEPYRVKLRVCERTKQALTHAYNAIPDEVRQDCHLEYQAQLRALDKKR